MSKGEAKEYFPNDEFKQQIVIDAINWATKELEKENAELQHKVDTLQGFLDRDIEYQELQKENAEAKERIKTLEYRCENIKDTDTMELVALQKENAELKKLFADCDTCKRTCDIGNCCKFGSAYLPDVEKTLNKQRQLTKAKELLKRCYDNYVHLEPLRGEIEQFLKEIE